jgi:peroxiredoxin
MVTFRRFAAFLCLLSLGFAQQPQQPAKPRPCPDTPIRTVDSKVIKISQYRGKTVMIVMFLTSCADCLATLQVMDKFQKELGPHGFQVVAVSLDESSANLLPYAQRYRFGFPLGHLEKEGAIQLAGLAKDAHPIVPLIMFVDWMGNVRFQYFGDNKVLAGADAEKNLHGIANGLIRQADAKQGPQYQTKPAGK